MTGPARSRLLLVAAVAVPALVLGVAGMFHPARLTPETAERWRDIHVLALPLFPLLGLGPWLIARAVNPVAGWVGLLLGYVYACFYTGLDLIAGATAGALKIAGSADLDVVFRLGSGLGDVGVWAHLAGASLAAGLALWRVRLRALPGALLVVAASISFLDSHIYWPRGVVTLFLLATGWAALAVSLPVDDDHGAARAR